MIVIGVDAHRDTHTATAIVASTAMRIAHETVPAREHGHEALLAWAGEIDQERVWAIEDARVWSGALERFLLERGERVLRVPPKMMSGHRKSVRQTGKSDPIYSHAVALAAVREPDLPVGRLHGPAREIRLLADHRDDLVQDCGRYQSRLRLHLHEIDPELAPAPRNIASRPTLERLSRQLTRRPQSAQVVICRDLLRRIRELTRAIAELHKQLRVLVLAQAPELLELEGCGVVLASRVIAEVETIERFKHERSFANYTGVAPLDASSGKQNRHRLNRTGNRRLNRALHIIAVTQMRTYTPAKEYIARRRAEGKTNREAMRALKRLIARRLYRILLTSHKNALTNT